MNPEVWKEVIIGISVQADQNSHIMENKYGRKDIEVGGTISDKGLDGRNAFSTVKVKAMDNESLTITYGITDHTLNKDKQWIQLDTGGRDYATFELYVSIQF